MYWFILSLCSALSKSFSDVASKKVMQTMDVISVGCVARGLVAFIAFLIVAFQGIPNIGPAFIKAVIVSGLINVFTTFLSLKALKEGELSLVSPILVLSPVFLLITSPLINNQFPTILGTVGILFSMGGIYQMKIKEKKLGWIEPIKAIWRSKGVKSALIVAFLWSISANYDSVGTINSSPFFFILVVNFFIFACFLPFALIKKDFFTSIKKNFKGLAALSVFMTSEVGFQFAAFELAIVPYVISIKRTSALFSVFWGKQIFKEESEFKDRLSGAILVVIGLVLIKLFG
ncbi:MAG TPA: DMT family transporter [Candidatus Moranbacteria bacterium]|nr:DMT family transporter [Candidatus Moranbacteria bacterium]HRZ33767.1 DMT family transporter [Candidatus Moranbacteria bacterium]